MTTDLQQIVPPADFPVTWDDPADAKLPWRLERWHVPGAVPPLASDILLREYSGFRRGARARGRAGGMDGRRINGYVYFCVRPLTMSDPEALGAEPQPPFEENHATWDSLWLPQVQAYLTRWRAACRRPSPPSARAS